MRSVKQRASFWRIVAAALFLDDVYLRWLAEQSDLTRSTIEGVSIRLMSLLVIMPIAFLIALFFSKFLKPFVLKYMGIPKDAK